MEVLLTLALSMVWYVVCYVSQLLLFPSVFSFGTIPAQMKSFLEAMSLHWQSGGLLGKPSGMFTSSGISESGLQAILISIVAYMVHNGMIFVPVGTTYEPDWFGERAVKLDPLNESGMYFANGLVLGILCICHRQANSPVDKCSQFNRRVLPLLWDML